MTVVRLHRRLEVLESKRVVASANLDHLSDEELEAMVVDVRARIFGEFEARGVALPPGWQAMTQTQQDRWADAKARELDG